MVVAHVLQKSDVGAVVRGRRIAIADEVTDSDSEDQGGQTQGDEVERVLPPRQHDLVIEIVDLYIFHASSVSQPEW